jgi:hypothetical protein
MSSAICHINNAFLPASFANSCNIATKLWPISLYRPAYSLLFTRGAISAYWIMRQKMSARYESNVFVSSVLFMTSSWIDPNWIYLHVIHALSPLCRFHHSSSNDGWRTDCLV